MTAASILQSLPAACARLRRSALTPVCAGAFIARKRRGVCSTTSDDTTAAASDAAAAASDSAADLHLIQSILSGIMAPYWGERLVSPDPPTPASAAPDSPTSAAPARPAPLRPAPPLQTAPRPQRQQ